MANKPGAPYALWFIWGCIVALVFVYARDVAANLVWVKGAPVTWWVFVVMVVVAVTTGAITSTCAWWKHRRRADGGSDRLTD